MRISINLSAINSYNKLKKTLIDNHVIMVIAVPNDLVYSYWKNVVKWKDIGLLQYYALPVKAGNVLKKSKPIL